MDIKKGTYTYSVSDDQKRYVPTERVSSPFQLYKGDHIAIERLCGCYWHHAIVEDVETEKGIINVIEYSSYVEELLQDISCSRSPGKGKVMRGKYRLEYGLYLIRHKKCLPADTVVLRARSRIGEINYSFLKNNCEHFAMWCKTNISSSEQVKNIEETVTKTFRDEIRKTALLLVAMRTRTSAGVPLMEGVRLAVFLEVLLAAYDINCAKEDLIAGEISLKSYNDAICKRIMGAAFSIAGSIVGEAVGQDLDSVVGRFVGRFVGGLIGRYGGTILWKVFVCIIFLIFSS